MGGHVIHHTRIIETLALGLVERIYQMLVAHGD